MHARFGSNSRVKVLWTKTINSLPSKKSVSRKQDYGLVQVCNTLGKVTFPNIALVTENVRLPVFGDELRHDVEALQDLWTESGAEMVN